MVTVIVPCRNERRHIRACLESILSNDYPKERIEILVVDGMSDDGTQEVVAEVAARTGAVKLIPNPRRIVSSALNLGILQGKGQIILRMDAHNEYPSDYVTGLVGWLERTGADNVGGAWITHPAGPSAIARAIALALAHPFGIGNARFRLGTSEPREVDTVPFGCFRRELFGRLGLFDEELVRNQDDEFNARILRSGGRIVLVPDVVSHYYARGSLGKLARMYFQYGWFKPYVVSKIGRLTTWRQLVPPVFLLALAAGGLLAPIWPAVGYGAAVLGGGYALATAVVAAGAVRRNGIGTGLALLAVLPVLHLSYGFGYLYGLARLALRRKTPPGEAVSLPLSR
jgi:glycosyltransferase involved in cell wall biosynthesis